MEHLTPEQIAKSVLAAYDSVSLINELTAIGILNTEQTSKLSRNKEHLVIMLDKTWFSNALTAAQKIEIIAKSV